MMTPPLPSNLANALSPFALVGKSPVGEESPEARNTPFKPVEELAATERQSTRTSTPEQAAEAEARLAGDTREGSPGRDEQGSEEQDLEEQQKQQQLIDQAVIDRLASRDREVRAHEQAHSSVGGQLAGSARFQYERGPDGVSYAVGGEVSISTGGVANDPEATLANARTVQQAALAPADPSPQDRRVAADAAQLQRQAIDEIAVQAQQERVELDEQREQQRQEQEQERDRFNQEDEERREQQSAQDDRQRDAQDEQVRGYIDLNQRLIDIGVSQSATPVGGLLNQTA